MNGRVAKQVLLLVAAALLLSGCWPARFTYQPGVTGTVVSADDGRPVVGASINLFVPRQDLLPASASETNSEGKFLVEPLYDWGVASFVGERGPIRGYLEITASGFAPNKVGLGWSKPSTLDLGVIQLVRASE